MMLQALVDGQRDPATLADLAQRRIRVKIPDLTEALTGRFSEHHAFLARMYLDVIDQRTRQIEELNTRIEVVMEPFQSFCALICTIPGIGQRYAEVIDPGRYPPTMPGAPRSGRRSGLPGYDVTLTPLAATA